MLSKKAVMFGLVATVCALSSIGTVSVLNAENNATSFSSPGDNTLGTYSESLRDKKHPILNLEGMYGTDVSVMSEALKRSTVDAKEPTVLPKDIELKKTMTEGTADLPAQMITTIYGPTSIDYSEFTSFMEVLDNKGIIVIQTHEEKEYDKDSWMRAFVEQIGENAQILSVDGSSVISIEGDPENGITSEVILHKRNVQIDVISVAYNEDDLLKIASTL